MDIPQDFKDYAAQVVARHFKDAPPPDGTTETNRKHIVLRDIAHKELCNRIAILCLKREVDYEYRRYAESVAQDGIYALFRAVPVKKNKRYKGAKDWPGR